MNSFQLSLGRLKKLLHEAGIAAKVEGRLVFMNPDYRVAFDESVSVECIARDGILNMFTDIIQLNTSRQELRRQRVL